VVSLLVAEGNQENEFGGGLKGERGGLRWAEVQSSGRNNFAGGCGPCDERQRKIRQVFARKGESKSWKSREGNAVRLRGEVGGKSPSSAFNSTFCSVSSELRPPGE